VVVADMEEDKVADIVANMEEDKVANMVADMEGRSWWLC
jgi:flagellar motility protein MotE (MotC chaperone)